MNNAYLALGTNIEPREFHLQQALKLLEKSDSINIIKQSSVYETEPVGYTEQNDFLNMVIEIQTSLPSMKLLEYCQEVEWQLGRVRDIRFGPRTIDLDILTYNQENSRVERLIIPHPRMHERAFVLIPLQEIAPELMIPIQNRRVVDIIDSLPESDIEGVRKWTQNELGKE